MVLPSVGVFAVLPRRLDPTVLNQLWVMPIAERSAKSVLAQGIPKFTFLLKIRIYLLVDDCGRLLSVCGV